MASWLLLFPQIDITGENYVSGNTLDNIRMYTDVVQAAFSMNGDWLATVEEQRAADIRDVQCRVKFWIFDKQKQRYQAALISETKRLGSGSSNRRAELFLICIVLS